MKCPVLICAVSRGWQSSRELALKAMRSGQCVDILIKGPVEKPVLDMITKYPAIKITAVSRFWFEPILFLKCLKGVFCQRLKAVAVEGKRIEKWIYILGRCFRFSVFLAEKGEALGL